MEFSAPAYAWLVIPVALLLVMGGRDRRNRQASLALLAEPHLLDRLAGGERHGLGRFRQRLPCLVMLLLVVALMGPRWGAVDEVQSASGLDIVIAMDVSRSMLADDLSPSRLAAAKKGVEALLGRLGGDRVGLVAFAGSAFQICPLTSDHAVVRQMLHELGPDTMPRGGSSLAAALTEAVRAFRGTQPGGRVLILVTDGENHAGEVTAALAGLRREGIAVFAALAGTETGGVMPLADGRFVEDRQGSVVKSRASRAALAAIDPDHATLDADGSGIDGLLTRARATGIETARSEQRRRLAERYQIPLAAALLLWIAGLVLPERRSSP